MSNIEEDAYAFLNKDAKNSTGTEFKAFTVVAFNGLPTSKWFDLIKDEPALLNGIVHRERLVIFGGGVPIRVGGVLVGAIGCSGGSAEEDEIVAQAGADAVV